ncbi:MAG: 50S ribosomal protein L10 [Solirubrobacteraceae bacterium]
MNREQKAATIDALASELKDADAVFAVDYRGLTVGDAAKLRTKLRAADATFRIVKNSLTERAADQAGVGALKELLQGPTALAFVHGDPALTAKAIADIARAIQLLPFKGGVMGAESLAPEQLTALSRLPSREVLYGQLVGVIASPVSGLVRTLNALISGLAVALGQVQEQRAKEEPAEAAQAPADSGQATPDADSETAEQAEASPAQAAGPEGEAPAEQPAQEPPAGGAQEPDTQAEAQSDQDDNQPEAPAAEQPEAAAPQPPDVTDEES